MTALIDHETNTVAFPPRSLAPPTEIAYVKYSVAGNTFLVIDESRRSLPDDAARSRFARWALDDQFGVGGADNLLFVAEVPDPPGPFTYRFRIFEQDGAETLSCGNGLLAVADLIRAGGNAGVTILTELPTGSPRAAPAGTDADGWTWVGMGSPRPVPADLYRPTDLDPAGPAPEVITAGVTALQLTWPVDISGPLETLTATGHLVFTGEPHLVFVLDHGFPGELREALFAPEHSEHGVRLLDRIGRQLNRYHGRLFPQGVHVDVVDVAADGLVRLRTWERAINKETFACGTGALACAHVVQLLGLTAPASVVEVHPHRAGWTDPDSVLRVSSTAEGLVLAGRPVLVCHGAISAAAGLPPHPGDKS